jgi:hypothetical protein
MIYRLRLATSTRRFAMLAFKSKQTKKAELMLALITALATVGLFALELMR